MKDYRWSSYHAYAYRKKDLVVDEHPIYKELSINETDRSKRYREFIKVMLTKSNAMKSEMDRRMIYGSKDFADQIKREYELESLMKPKGRPRKGGREKH